MTPRAPVPATRRHGGLTPPPIGPSTKGASTIDSVEPNQPFAQVRCQVRSNGVAAWRRLASRPALIIQAK